MTIILDTSIWIEYFIEKAEYFDICQQFLEKAEISTIEIIFGELLQGALNKQGKRIKINLALIAP